MSSIEIIGNRAIIFQTGNIEYLELDVSQIIGIIYYKNLLYNIIMKNGVEYRFTINPSVVQVLLNRLEMNKNYSYMLASNYKLFSVISLTMYSFYIGYSYGDMIVDTVYSKIKKPVDDNVIEPKNNYMRKIIVGSIFTLPFIGIYLYCRNKI